MTRSNIALYDADGRSVDAGRVAGPRGAGDTVQAVGTNASVTGAGFLRRSAGG
jgi:hypothetical protein